MATKSTHFQKKLFTLERMRRDTENNLDKSYLQNNISELVSLEEKYVTIIQRISKVKEMLASGKRLKLHKKDSGDTADEI